MLAELSAAVRDGRVHPKDLVTEALRRVEADDGRIGTTAPRIETAIRSILDGGSEGALVLLTSFGAGLAWGANLVRWTAPQPPS